MIRARETAWWRAAVAALVVLVVVAGLAHPGEAAADDEQPQAEPATVVVKVEPGVDVGAVLAEHGLGVVRPLVGSRGLYLAGPASGDATAKELEKLAKEAAKASGVIWAELDPVGDDPEDDRFHAWPDGVPLGRGEDPAVWTAQPGLASLQLDAVHHRSTGEGVVVAVLDTGVDLRHPHLQDHLGSGHYDYIDDDPDPSEEADGWDDDGDGRVDESYGHGTHAAGLVALVAPDAEIVVYRVLDADGHGHPHVIAQAIEDAVAAGADVINVSFGMGDKPKSKVVREAFKMAAKHDVLVVAAIGNDGRKSEQFPAKEKDVIGVAAMGRGNRYLARFSNYGKRALVAAPGEDIVSTLPGGGFGAWSGTSMAAPIVTGQVALVRASSSDRKLDKVIAAVGKSASKIEDKNKVDKGLIDILASLDR